jgi:phosphate transport system ATP-binding protein
MIKLLPAIRVKNLSLYYKTQEILREVSMEIPRNQITAIIGPNGCGKSAFLKSLNRMIELEPEVEVKGNIEFFGQNIYERRINLSRLRRQITIIYSNPNLFPMSIYDNVAYGVKFIGWRPKAELDEIVELSLKIVDLWEEVKNRLHKPALELSHGQQLRLCIARSLAVKPKILLIDDLGAGLDTLTTMKIESLLQYLRSELTIVFISHNRELVSRLSDFTAIFHYNEEQVGTLLEFAPTKKIFAHNLNLRTHDLRFVPS